MMVNGHEDPEKSVKFQWSIRAQASVGSIDPPNTSSYLVVVNERPVVSTHLTVGNCRESVSHHVIDYLMIGFIFDS
jgi:hypothetical protein